MENVNYVNFVLKFGKYKGTKFCNTPNSYQMWLIKQDWFKETPQYLNMRKCTCGGLKNDIHDEDCGEGCVWRFNGKAITKVGIQ